VSDHPDTAAGSTDDATGNGLGTSVTQSLLDRLRDFQVRDDQHDDPVLLTLDGTPVDTWRDGYPYPERVSRDEYEQGKRLLQIELLKLQSWIKASGQRVVILFEGRDAAGKGGAIKRFMEHLNPRGVLVLRLPARAADRFLIRQIDPVRRWKLSPTDLASLDRWQDYTDAREAMFFYTDTADAPWTVNKSNDKKRARLQAIRHLLTRFDYDGKDPEVVGTPDPLLVGRASLLFEEGERTALPFPQL